MFVRSLIQTPIPTKISCKC